MGFFPTITDLSDHFHTVLCTFLSIVLALFVLSFITFIPAYSQEHGTDKVITGDKGLDVSISDVSHDEAISLIDSLQTESILYAFLRKYPLAERSCSLQIEVGRAYYEKSGDSTFLEVTRAGKRRLDAVRLDKLMMLYGSFDRDAQIDTLLAVHDVYEKYGFKKQDLITKVWLGEFYLAFKNTNYPEACANFLDVLSSAREENLPFLEECALIGLARLFELAGRIKVAKEFFEKARESAEIRADSLSLYRALYGLARVELVAGDPGTAYQRLREIQELSVRILKRDEGTIHNALGRALLKLGDLEGALRELNQAREWAAHNGFEKAYLSASFSLGRVYEEGCMPEEAKKTYEEVIHGAASSCMNSAQWNAALRLGIVAEKEDKTQDALSYYREAISCLESNRGETGLAELKLPFLEHKMEPYEHLIGLLYRTSRGSLSKATIEAMALEYCERSRMTHFLDGWAQKTLREDGKIERELLTSERELIERINQLRMRIILHGGSRTEQEEAVKEIEDSKLKLMEMKLAGELSTSRTMTGSDYPDILMLDEMRSRILNPGTCVIEYFVGETFSCAWLIKQDGMKMVELHNLSSGYPPVTLYIDLLSQEEGQPYLSVGRRLYRDLLLPFEDDLQGVSSIVFVTDDVLNYLPFESLPAGYGSRNGDYERYLIDEFEISYAPSILTLIHLLDRSDSPVTAGDRILALGDPLDSGQTGFFERLMNEFTGNLEGKESSSLPGREAWSFPRLKKSGDEVKRVTAFFHENCRTVLLGSEADEEGFKREPLQEYQVLHFATHGIYDNESPEFSAILLSDNSDEEDGLLMVREISRLKLNASLVVLSGCKTGLGSYVRGEGVVGLTRAFLTAGASSMVVSLWDVDDELTADFMEEFYELYRSGLGKRGALSVAKRHMRREGKKCTEWAPFILIGDYR